MIDIDGLIGDLRVRLESVAVAEDAEPMAAYMKHQAPFLGVKTPGRRQQSKPLLVRAKSWSADELLDVADALFEQPEREFHQVACDLLRRWSKTLGSDDLDRIRRIIQTKSWWDTVDALAVHVLGPVVRADRTLQVDIDDWIEDEDIWVARSAILHQLMWKDDIDADRLFGYCDLRAEDTEFFIRKAMGWALRQHARTDPEAVALYVHENADRLSGLTKREALKHL